MLLVLILYIQYLRIISRYARINLIFRYVVLTHFAASYVRQSRDLKRERERRNAAWGSKDFTLVRDNVKTTSMPLW